MHLLSHLTKLVVYFNLVVYLQLLLIVFFAVLEMEHLLYLSHIVQQNLVVYLIFAKMTKKKHYLIFMVLQLNEDYFNNIYTFYKWYSTIFNPTKWYYIKSNCFNTSSNYSDTCFFFCNTYFNTCCYIFRITGNTRFNTKWYILKE